MSGFLCTEHPGAIALFSCDGCARLLCADCTREGHRLYFCRHCGERAVAMELHASSSVTERQRAEKVERPYALGEALAYPFRGGGRLMLPALVLAFVAADLLPLVGPAFRIATLFLLPGLLFEIVRTTAEGAVELPDWPDYSEFWERIRDLLWMLVVQAMLVLPVFVCYELSDCDFVAYLLGDRSPSCRPARLAGLALGGVLAVFSLGATGTHSSGWLAFRVDLHLRALLSRAGIDGLKVTALAFALLAASDFVSEALAGLPLAGTAVTTAISGYAVFTAAHLIGIVFRRHAAALDPIYRD